MVPTIQSVVIYCNLQPKGLDIYYGQGGDRSKVGGLPKISGVRGGCIINFKSLNCTVGLAGPRPHPSFGMTMTKILEAAFLRHASSPACDPSCSSRHNSFQIHRTTRDEQPSIQYGQTL